jgi:uncharacterized protein (TIGR03083 family)
MDYRRTYRSAAVAVVDLVSRVPAGRWDDPALGEWSVRDLTGHLVSSALRQVPEVLATPAEKADIEAPEGYWAFARSAPPDLYAAASALSARDARETGRRLGDDPVEAVREAAGRATQALAGVGDDDPVATPAGGMRVRDWLPTRTFELVVHGLDLAAAVDLEPSFFPDAVAEATALAAKVAVAVGDGPQILRALTGRTPLPPGFSVV